MWCLLVLAFVAAAHGADPKPCCMSHQWSGVMVQVGATKQVAKDPQIVDNMYKLDYDYDTKKMMLIGTTLDQSSGALHNLTVYDDFANGKRYTVYDGACTVAPVPPESMTAPCIPANFTFEGSYTLGSGANSVTVNSFSGAISNSQMRFTMTDDCYPVTYTQYGSSPDGNTQAINSFVFSNLKQGLSKTNPFVAPQNCKDAPATVG